MSQKEVLHDAHSSKILGFGHLGTVEYNSVSKTWRTLRQMEPSPIPTFGPGRRTSDLPSVFPFRHVQSSIADKKPVNAQHISAQIGITDCEENIPACPSSTGRCSKAARQTTEDLPEECASFDCDDGLTTIEPSSKSSQLLAFGNALVVESIQDESERTLVPIAASVTGYTAESIRLVALAEESTEALYFDRQKGRVSFPSINGGLHTEWQSKGQPVRQVHFASRTGLSSTWMAARLVTATIIFRPTVPDVSGMLSASQSELGRPCSSWLRPNPILTIPLARTGGYPHADVSFDRHHRPKMALIDEHGNWSVWKIEVVEREQMDTYYQLSLLSKGKIWTWNHEQRPRMASPYHDGWHRLSWIEDTTTHEQGLLFCNRRLAAVYGPDGSSYGLIDLRHGLSHKRHCLLDIKSSSSSPDDIFLLTSTHLLWTKVRSAKNWRDEDIPVSWLVLAWQHFRNLADTTLHLTLLEIGEATLVLIVSQVVELVSVFSFGVRQNGTIRPMTSAVPGLWMLPKHPRSLRLNNLPLSSAFHVLQTQTEGQGVDKSSNAFLATLFTMHKNLDIIEHLFASTELARLCSSKPLYSHALAMPAAGKLGPSITKSFSTESLESFVVYNRVGRQLNLHCSRTSHSAKFQRPTEKCSLSSKVRDWQGIYAYIVKNQHDAGKADGSLTNALQSSTLPINSMSSGGVELLSTFLSLYLRVEEVDGDSDRLEGFVSSIAQRVGPERIVKRFALTGSAKVRQRTLVDIYNLVIASQVDTLDSSVIDRVRVVRERLARAISVALIASTTALLPAKTEPVLESETPNSQAGRKKTEMTLPVSSPALSSAERMKPNPVADNDTMSTSLSAYTEVTKLPSAAYRCHPSLTSVLLHLPTTFNVDPSDYRFSATEHDLREARDSAAAEAAARADPQARRKAGKLQLAKAKKDHAKLKAAEVGFTPLKKPPQIYSSPGIAMSRGVERNVQSSQLGRTGSQNEMSSSSQVYPEPLAMSQPEKGLFGQRPTKKDKPSAKRRAGF